MEPPTLKKKNTRTQQTDTFEHGTTAKRINGKLKQESI